MEFIEHTINWAKGEIQEAIIMGIAGLMIIISALLFWKFGNTPYAKAMVLPLLVVGLLPFINSFSGVKSNKTRIVEYTKQYEANPQAFVLSEKERVESFDEIFKYTYPMAIILTIGGAILFFIVGKSPAWKAISLAMITLGLMTYVIDHFAAERADIYLEKINESIEVYKPKKNQ
ncbi:MAG: hypothetical protein N4A71_13930 [Carboxylicivirga sp.]|jgi:hypothetical protein|nr:hypothetical protein [Carboxylicivirga sp.]